MKPTIMMPSSYVLPGFHWLWCKLSDVTAVVPEISRLAETGYEPTAEEIVSHFAALIRPNRFTSPGSAGDAPKKKLFRYCVGGTNMLSKEVSVGLEDSPPYGKFFFDIDLRYGNDLFVPSGWVTDVLYAVRNGAVAAADTGKMRFGFPPRGSEGDLIYLSGERVGIAARMPEFLK